MHDYNQYVTAINKIFDYIEKMKAGWDNQDNMNYIEKIEAFQTTVTGCASEFKKPPSHVAEEDEVGDNVQQEEVVENTMEEPQEGEIEETKEEEQTEKKEEEVEEEKKEDSPSPLPAIQAGTAPIAGETPIPTPEGEQSSLETQEAQTEPTALEIPEAPEAPPVLAQPAQQESVTPGAEQAVQPAQPETVAPAQEQVTTTTEEVASTPTPTEIAQSTPTTLEAPVAATPPAGQTGGLKPLIPVVASSDSPIQIPSQLSLNPPDMPTPQLPADSPIPSLVTNHVEETKEPETSEMDEKDLVEETGATSVVAG